MGRFLPLWPIELDDLTPAGRDRVVRLLARALRHERRRGIEGHWAYDLSRHATLLAIYRAEVRARNAVARIYPATGTNREFFRDRTPPGLVLPAMGPHIPPHIPNDIGPPPS